MERAVTILKHRATELEFSTSNHNQITLRTVITVVPVLLCVVLAVPGSSTLCKGDEDNVLSRYRPFYATEKGITGRRAHNPIHPGKKKAVSASRRPMQVPFSVVYGESSAVAAALTRVKP